MIWNTKNGSVKIGDTSMDFVYGGSGEKKLFAGMCVSVFNKTDTIYSNYFG